jgi:hypothetical protein
MPLKCSEYGLQKCLTPTQLTIKVRGDYSFQGMNFANWLSTYIVSVLNMKLIHNLPETLKLVYLTSACNLTVMNMISNHNLL